MLLTHIGGREGRRSNSGATVPGGAANSMQYNNAGAFGGTNATYDSAKGKITFAPSVNFSGFNFGSFATDPGTVVNGDAWYNSTNDRTRIVSSFVAKNVLFSSADIPSGRILFGSAGGDTATQSVSLVYTSASNTFATGRGIFTNANNQGAINLTPAPGDPVGPSNGDLWYDSTANLFKARQNGATVAVIGTAPGGINTSLQYNNGGVFGGTSATFSSVTGTVTFTPTGTFAGLNVGSFAGTPGTNTAGDITFNSTAQAFEFTGSGSITQISPPTAAFPLNLFTKAAGASNGQSVSISTGTSNLISGFINIFSGASSTSSSGNMGFGSGTASTISGTTNILTGNTSAGPSGNILLQTGTGTTGTGPIALTTGNASAGNSGGITFTTGTASGTRGNITFAAPQILLTHLQGNTAAPGIAAGTGAGTGPTVSLTRASDLAGTINVLTGTTPAASATVVTITFAVGYTAQPTIILTPANAATAALAVAAQVFAVAPNTTTFTITSNATNLTATTQYAWQYTVIQ